MTEENGRTVTVHHAYCPPGVRRVLAVGSSAFIGQVDGSTVLKYPLARAETRPALRWRGNCSRSFGPHGRIIALKGFTDTGIYLERAANITVAEYMLESRVWQSRHLWSSSACAGAGRLPRLSRASMLGAAADDDNESLGPSGSGAYTGWPRGQQNRASECRQGRDVSALLHDLQATGRRSIVHRDIKPSNILVQHRHADDIYVKLGDFGLSREGPDPTTICGSWRYLAPEVYDEKNRRAAHYDRRSYTLAVDIWSLGVTVFECTYDLPCCKATGVLWCEEIVKKLRRDLKHNPDDLKQFLWDTMVILQPNLRGTAQYCYDQVLLLADSAQNRSLTPTQAAYAQEYRQPVSQHSVEDQQTVLLQDTHRVTGTLQSTSLDHDPAELRRYTRSNGPPPDSVGSLSTRKRIKDSPSSSNRNTKRHALSSQLPPSEPRRFPELWDALHPLGGGSSLAALIGQEVSDPNSSTTRTSALRSAQDPVDDGANRAQLSEVHSPDPDPYLAGGNAFMPAGAQVVAVASTDSEQELVAKLLVEISQGR